MPRALLRWRRCRLLRGDRLVSNWRLLRTGRLLRTDSLLRAGSLLRTGRHALASRTSRRWLRRWHWFLFRRRLLHLCFEKLRRNRDGSCICSPLTLLFRQNKICPASRCASLFTDGIREDMHPTFFFSSTVCVEIDDLTVCESDAESLFNKHVSLFFFSESRLTATTRLGRRRLS